MLCEPECQIKIIELYVPTVVVEFATSRLVAFAHGSSGKHKKNWELKNKLVRKRSYCYSDVNKLNMLFFPCPQKAQIPHFLE